MDSIQKLQEDLIEKTRRHHEISPKIVKAFYQNPRHEYVPDRYSLAEAYADRPLLLYNDVEKGQRSTISQPSFVMYLLELLQVEEGQKVFEVGTGSGWNAALLSSLVGERGRVVTMEIIPEIASRAIKALQGHGLKNVFAMEGDAGHGWKPEAPYDRIIFTAAAAKIPAFVADQLQPQGRVLFVKEGRFGTDEVQILEKTSEGFTCLQKVPCHFVAMTGSATNAPNKLPS